MNIETTSSPSPNSRSTGQRRSRLDVGTVRIAACGRWRPTIYPALGIEVGHGKHMACPHCGGKDRFRCDDKGGSGSHLCNQCGAGDGFSLVMKVRGCTFLEAVRRVAGVLGCDVSASSTSSRQPIIQKLQKLNKVELAFQFEMGALDRRLRADAVLQAVENFNGDLSDQERDRFMNAVAQAYEDRARAEFLETMADDFRWKAFEEGRKAHAA